MTPLLGFMLIEPSGIALRIYQNVQKQDWQLLFGHNYPILITNARFPDAIKLIEVLAESFSDVFEFGVGEWNVWTKNIEQPLRKDLSNAIQIKIFPLTPEKEEELIFRGLLIDLIK